MAATRYPISYNDLQAVMDAAKLLRKYDLISAVQIRAVRAMVHDDVNTYIARYGEQSTAMLASLWQETRPLGNEHLLPKDKS